MKSATSLFVALALVTQAALPRLACADEREIGAHSWVTPESTVGPRILLTTAETLALTTPSPAVFAASAPEIRRLSSGAIAVIVVAIVVGVLLVVGVGVFAARGHPR